MMVQTREDDAELSGEITDKLAGFRRNWGSACEIGWDPEDGYWAGRRDGLDSAHLHHHDPEQFREMLITELAQKPVPHEYRLADGDDAE